MSLFDIAIASKLSGGGGGGGSSDLSKATITLDITFPEDYYTVYVEARLGNGELGSVIVLGGQDYMETFEFDDAAPSTFELVLFNGVGKLLMGSVTNVTGGGAYDADEGMLTVTGDCTVSVTAEEPE